MKKILETEFFEMDIGFAYRFLNNLNCLMDMHVHNYYEYFFITSGSIIHRVNGIEKELHVGDLLLIRPNDYHGYRAGNEKFELINVSFSTRHLNLLCDYFGPSIREMIDSPAMPPLVNISPFQENALIQEHEYLNFYTGDRMVLENRLKLLLTEVVGLFIRHSNAQSTDHEKKWLEIALEKMNSQANIEEGIPALLRVTGFSHGHLCRIMKKHLGVTPVEYLTNLRLVYASNLLTHSNLDILTISMRVGYTSLSHFITLFKKKYEITPSKYREKYGRPIW